MPSCKLKGSVQSLPAVFDWGRARRMVRYALTMKSPSRSIITLMAAGVLALTAFGQAPSTGGPGSGVTGTGTTGSATASQPSPSASRANLESLFKALDTNADGSVSREEFLNG